jgi:hypothetical protein
MDRMAEVYSCTANLCHGEQRMDIAKILSHIEAAKCPECGGTGIEHYWDELGDGTLVKLPDEDNAPCPNDYHNTTVDDRVMDVVLPLALFSKWGFDPSAHYYLYDAYRALCELCAAQGIEVFDHLSAFNECTSIPELINHVTDDNQLGANPHWAAEAFGRLFAIAKEAGVTLGEGKL